MKNQVRVFIIEDDLAIATSLQRVLEDEHRMVLLASRGDEGLATALAETFDVVITDLRLPGLDGLAVVRRLHEAKPRVPILVMTAHGTTDTAIEAIKFGAFDYLPKPFEISELLGMVDKAVASSRLMSEVVTLGGADAARDAIVGRSRTMQEIYKEIGRVAARPVNVLIRGETGTGKELIARALYQHSERASAAFIAVNCAAIPETLLESELFGHERGAFTGAEARRIGRFEQAHGGTLFLDEIGDLPPGTQVKLLRVLQDKYIQRLGGKETIQVDVRVLAATHRDLEAMLRQREFREDLYYRLNVASLVLPPLRERREDIPELVRYFLARYGPDFGQAQPLIQPEAIQFLQAQTWPGNVRELENAIRKMLLLSRGFAISLEHVQEAMNVPTGPDAPTLKLLVTEALTSVQRAETGDAHARVIGVVERELFAQALQLAGGNQAKAARWLGLSRLTLREKLRAYGLRPAGESGPEDGVV